MLTLNFGNSRYNIAVTIFDFDNNRLDTTQENNTQNVGNA